MNSYISVFITSDRSVWTLGIVVIYLFFYCGVFWVTSSILILMYKTRIPVKKQNKIFCRYVLNLTTTRSVSSCVLLNCYLNTFF